MKLFKSFPNYLTRIFMVYNLFFFFFLQVNETQMLGSMHYFYLLKEIE